MRRIIAIILFALLSCVTFLSYTHSQMQDERDALLGRQNQILETSYKAVIQMYKVSIESYFKYIVLHQDVLDILHEAKDATAQDLDKTVVDSTLSRCKLLNTSGNDFVAISTSHPVYVSYLASQTVENQTRLQNEFNRISANFNTYVKAKNLK